jgi:hypothetical protein
MTFQKTSIDAGRNSGSEKMNIKMIQKRISQNNTNSPCKCIDDEYMHNMLINRCLTVDNSDRKIIDVNKMLLVLIFLMVNRYNVLIEYIFSHQLNF